MGIVTSIVLAVVALASAAVSAYGQYQSGKAADAAAEYNAEVARNNATQAEAWAQYNAKQEARKQRANRSSMISAYAKSGVVIEDGASVGTVMNEQLVQDELAIQGILRAGQAQRSSLMSQADQYEIEGNNARSSATLGAISTGLKGIASAASIAGAGSVAGSTAASSGVGSGVSSSEFSLGASSYAPGRA